MAQNPGSALAVTNGDAELAAIAAVKNDLSALSEGQRAQLYGSICKSIGLNPLTSPFEFIKLNGKLQLYAKKGATDQIRDLRGITITETHKEIIEGVLVMTVTATDKNGRSDTDIGAVPIKGLQGEALGNAMMKALTKAKRRVTLSLAGLGFLDESEVDSIPTERVQRVNVSPMTGVIEEMPLETIRAIPDGSDDWHDASKRLHAVAANHGFDHDDLHRWAVSVGKSGLSDMPANSLRIMASKFELETDKAVAYFEQLRANGQELAEVTAALNAQLDAAVEDIDPETGEIIPAGVGAGGHQSELIDMPIAHPGHGDS
jgi:hypothetical protein